MGLLIKTQIGSGDLLDHFLLDDLVATGGMASTFRATDTRTGRPVAVKIPHPGKAGDRNALDRFQHETVIGRKFDHPGLVKVLHYDGIGHRYSVMEWVEGRLLREVMDEQRILPVERAIRITLAICDALEYVHGHGIVHGDLKPENIIVNSDDNIKLIDFGIARETKGSWWKRTMSWEAMGTPDYVSPEQIRGRQADARSDVYSLGVMLFEMLAGEVLFSSVHPTTAMNLRLSVDPPSLCEFNPDIALRLESIVHRAIERDTADRYASARKFSLDLSEFASQETVAKSHELAARF